MATFSAWMIHRGHYQSDYLRRTFDIIYGSSAEWYTPPPTCFLQPYLLDQLDENRRPVFDRFIKAHRDKWQRGDYDK